MRIQALGNAVVITAGPKLQRRDVEELERRLRLLGTVDLVRLDLARVRDVDDWVIGQLAEAVRRITLTVEFCGLSRHHRRLLRYLDRGEPAEPLLAVLAQDRQRASDEERLHGVRRSVA